MIYDIPKGDGERGKDFSPSHSLNVTLASVLICQVEMIIKGSASYKLSRGLDELLHAESYKCGPERVEGWLEDTQEIL